MLSCVLLAACFKPYVPAPLDTEAAPAAYEKRSLDGPALREFLVRNGVPAEPWPPAQWDLRALVLAGVARSPEIDVARAQVTVTRAAETTAAMRPNPGIGPRVEHHSERFPSDSPWSVGLVLDIPIVTGGKREARIGLAEAQSHVADIEVAASAWRVAARIRQGYFAYVGARRDLALAENDAALRAQETAMVERRAELGGASATERDLARLLAAESGVRLARARTLAGENRIALAEAVGVPPELLPDAAIALPADGERTTRVDARSAQATALLNRLDVHRALGQYEVTENALRVEIANQYPDVVLRPGYLWDRGDIVWLLAGFALLPVANRNEGPIAEAEARRALEAERFRALQIRVVGEARAAQARYENAVTAERDAAAVARDAAARVQRVEKRFTSGNADRLELTRARLEALAAARAAAAAATQADLATGALEDALQAPLAAAVDPGKAIAPLARQDRP